MPVVLSNPMQDIPVLTVSQATNAIKICLETTFPSLWIQGEISNCKLQSSGHLYFCLKDAKSQISAVMFKGEISSLKIIPKDGDHVIIHGEMNLYPPSGKYQVIVRELRQVGLGALLLKLEELKKKLHQKGFFNKERKRAIPKFPKRIGVVTSPTGAVIQDIIHVLTRRVGGFHLILNPVRVQGDGAAYEIARAIAQFNETNMVDVIIAGRGGGSLEDLWPFNEEIVAEAIFSSRIPIISAVGHETDHCIADYVADVRAPTPSAAAEIVVAEKAHQLLHLAQAQRRLQQQVAHQIKHHRQHLNGLLRHPLFQSPYALLGPSMQRLDHFKEDLLDSLMLLVQQKKQQIEARHRQLEVLKPTAQINHLRQILRQKRERLSQACLHKFNSCKRLFNSEQKRRQLQQQWLQIFLLYKERLNQKVHVLESINPKNLLKKGYSILFAEKEGGVITSVGTIKKGEKVRALFFDGELLAQVEDIYHK